ncbi:MAG: protein BatD [Methylococcaceae bacterium]|nr:protein BatD [Methylococcaceae bacterium]
MRRIARWPGGAGSFVMLILLLQVGSALGAVRLELDRNPVSMGETLDLSFTADDDQADDPDFSPLEADFEVLGNRSSHNLSWVNGKSASTHQWIVTVSPKHAGSIAIPAIRFGGESSNPLSLTVKDVPDSNRAQIDSEVFWEVEATPRNPYVQAQVIYTRRLVRKVNLMGDGLTDPQPADALVQRLGDGREYQQMRGGERYTVTEYRYAIFPQKSGTLHLEPVVLNAQISPPGGSRFSPFMAQSGRRIKIASEALDLEVRPIPADFTGSRWLPAESVRLDEKWSKDPPRTVVGEPLTRTVTIAAAAATVGELPELAAELSQGELKSYGDQPVLKEEAGIGGVASLRQEKLALIADRPGTYTVPGLELVWWNTKTDRQETVRIEPRRVTVAAADGSSASAAPPEAAKAPAIQAPAPAGPQEQAHWRWLALVLGGGWLATAVAWLACRRRRPAPEPPTRAVRPNPDVAAAYKELTKACRGDDPVAARDALLIWGRARWPRQPPVGLKDLAARVDGRLGEKIRELERLVYGPDRGYRWYGEELWRALQQQATPPQAGARLPAALEPLNRIGEAE